MGQSHYAPKEGEEEDGATMVPVAPPNPSPYGLGANDAVVVLPPNEKKED